MSTSASTVRIAKPITGRTVLLYFISFFGIIFAMNFYMVRVAVSTFSGVETESAYKAGLLFKNDIAASQAQDKRHWSIEATVRRDDGAELTIMARDADGLPLTGLIPEIRLAHPTDKRRDVILEVVETAAGQFRSVTPMPEGQWDLIIGLKRQADTVFRSKTRISV